VTAAVAVPVCQTPGVIGAHYESRNPRTMRYTRQSSAPAGTDDRRGPQTREPDSIMTEIVLDIEAVGPEWDQLDEPTREYLVDRARKQAIRDGVDPDQEPLDEIAAERTALELGLAEVVAIGMWLLPAQRGAVLLRTPKWAVQAVDGSWSIASFTLEDAKTRCFMQEQELLRAFWGGLEKSDCGRIITYNGRGYDGPVLMVRSAINGVQCRRQLVPYRYDLAEHCDLADVLGFQGSTRSMYSLDYWCRRFGIESPKEVGVSGADVARLFRAGEYQVIGEYVLRDVQQLALLYQQLADTMLGLFKGGPRLPVQFALTGTEG
jgi:hypothetical protein